QHLERLGSERGPEAPEPGHERAQHRIGAGEAVKRVDVEPEAADAPDFVHRRLEGSGASVPGRGHEEARIVDAAGPAPLVAPPAPGDPDRAAEHARQEAVGRVLAPEMETLERARHIEETFNPDLGLHGGLSVYQRPKFGRTGYWANLLRQIYSALTSRQGRSARTSTFSVAGDAQRTPTYARQSRLPRASSGSQLGPVRV